MMSAKAYVCVCARVSLAMHHREGTVLLASIAKHEHLGASGNQRPVSAFRGVHNNVDEHSCRGCRNHAYSRSPPRKRAVRRCRADNSVGGRAVDGANCRSGAGRASAGVTHVLPGPTRSGPIGGRSSPATPTAPPNDDDYAGTSALLPAERREGAPYRPALLPLTTDREGRYEPPKAAHQTPNTLHKRQSVDAV